VKPTPIRDQLLEVLKHLDCARLGLLAGASQLIEQAEDSLLHDARDAARRELDVAQEYLKLFRRMDTDFVRGVDLCVFPFEPLRSSRAAGWEEREREMDSWGIDDGPIDADAKDLRVRCRALAKSLNAVHLQRASSGKLRPPSVSSEVVQ